MGSSVDDELEEGEIREVEERSIAHSPDTIPYLDDFEEGEISAEKVEEEVMVSVQNTSAYCDDFEEGEISTEKVEEEVMVSVQNTSACCDDLEEGEIRDETNTSFTRQVEEVSSKRFNELLCLQYLECKKFKLLKNAHKMALEVNCSKKLSAQDFEILAVKLEKHMKAQHRILIAMLIEARNRELKLKEQWLEKAREGTLEVSFCETPLPFSGFKMKNFDYEVEMGDLAKNGNSLSDGMQLDVVDDEGSSGLETLLEGQVESCHEIADASQCNDNALNVTCVDPKGILTSPSIRMPSHEFERREEMSEERNETGCSETLLGDSETRAENVNLTLNPNCPEVIKPNSNFESGEEILGEHELAQVGTILIGSAETVQNPISNTNSPPEIVHSDQIVATDSNSHASIRSQECQVDPATNLSYSSGIATATNLRLRTEENIVVEPPLVNQNEAFVEQSATRAPAPDTGVGIQNLNVITEPPLTNQIEAIAEQSATRMPTPDTVLVNQLLQMMRHDVNTDPLQNELSSLRKLQKTLAEGHNQKMARLRTECERELDNTKRKFQKLEAEADAQWSNRRAHIDTAYQKLCMHRKLAEEFQQMFYRPNLIGQLPIQVNRAGIVGRAQFPSSRPQFTPNPIFRPAMPFAAQRPSATTHGLLPNPYIIPQVTQPCVTVAFMPSGQRPLVPMQGPQNFLNQPTLMHSSLVSQLNHMRPPSLSIPNVRMAMANFGNIQI